MAFVNILVDDTLILHIIPLAEASNFGQHLKRTYLQLTEYSEYDKSY